MKALISLLFLLLTNILVGQTIIDLRQEVNSKGLYFNTKNIDSIYRIGDNLVDRMTFLHVSNLVKITDGVIFSNLRFNCPASFDNVEFQKDCFFDKISFKGLANFDNSNFKQRKPRRYLYENEPYMRQFEDVVFNDCIFDDDLSFTRSSFEGRTFFRRIILNKKISLRYAKGNYMHFENIDSGIIKSEFTTFNNLILVNSTLKKINFVECSIKGLMDLQNIKTDELLLNITVPDTLILSNIQTNSEIDLTHVTFNNAKDSSEGYKHSLFLDKIDIDKLNIDYSHFKLIFCRTSHNSFGDAPYFGNAEPMLNSEIILLYEKLLKNFKNRGQIENYKLLDIEYKKFQDTSPFKFISSLNEFWWNFGYEKILIFKRCFQLLIFCWGITFLCLGKLQRDIYTLSSIPVVEVKTKKIYGNLYSSPFKRLWYSFAYSTTIFLLLSLKAEKLQLNSKWNNILSSIWVVIMHVLGLICLAYIANYILQK